MYTDTHSHSHTNTNSYVTNFATLVQLTPPALAKFPPTYPDPDENIVTAIPPPLLANVSHQVIHAIPSK
jgi:hypothetical protein